MFPALFASMIWKYILPEMLELLVPLNKYNDEPNDADKKLIVQEKKLESQGKEIKLLREMVIDLGKDSHPEKPFEDRISKLEAFEKQVRNKKVFKSLNE
mgnify:CR=1 FL=1